MKEGAVQQIVEQPLIYQKEAAKQVMLAASSF